MEWMTLQLSLSLRDRQDLVYFASLFRQERVDKRTEFVELF